MRSIGRTVGEIAIEALLRPLRPTGIDLTCIEPPTFLLVFEQIVGSRYVLELRLRLLVARMQIGMEFACQFFESVLDLLVGRRSIDAEGLVRVLHAHDPIQAAPQRTADRRLRLIESQSQPRSQAPANLSRHTAD
jgi:hypothetical protein